MPVAHAALLYRFVTAVCAVAGQVWGRLLVALTQPAATGGA